MNIASAYLDTPLCDNGGMETFANIIGFIGLVGWVAFIVWAVSPDIRKVMSQLKDD